MKPVSMSTSAVAMFDREQRQQLVTDWCGRTFGTASQQDRQKRVLRFLEEALELFQAEGGDPAQAEALLRRVYSRPVGEVAQEVGGVCVTLLSYCSAAGLSLDQCEAVEIERILDRPLEQARQRYADKSAAGF